MQSRTTAKYHTIANLLLIIVVLELALFASACKKQEPKQTGPKEPVTMGVAQIVEVHGGRV